MLDTSIEIENDVCTIHLKGNVNLKNAIQLRELIKAQVESGYLKVILNFAGNIYLDSSGIGAIFNSQKYLKEKNGTLQLKNLSNEIMSILKIASLDKHLNIIP